MPRPGGDHDRADHRLGRQVVAGPAVDPVRDERLDHGHQGVRGEVADRVGAGLHGRGGGRVVRVDAEQHLAAVEAHLLDGRGVVAGEPVVDLEDGPGQAAAVHRADDHLVVERAEQQQVLDDVGGAEHAVDAGPGQGQRHPLEQVGPVGHGHRPVPGAQRAAGRVVGGDEEDLVVLAERRRSGGGAGPPPRRWPAGGAPAPRRMALIWSRTALPPVVPRLEDRRPRPPWAWRPSRPAGTPRWRRRRSRSASRVRCPSRPAARGTAPRRTRRRRRGRS